MLWVLDSSCFIIHCRASLISLYTGEAGWFSIVAHWYKVVSPTHQVLAVVSHLADLSCIWCSIINMEIQFSLIDHYTIGDVGQAFIQADYFNEAKD
jgi:hypothetical protein